MRAFKHRQSDRAFDPRPLSDTLLGNLLWAACGVNRPESGKRTAPTALNNQEIDVYAARADGLFRYAAASHSLEKVHGDDIRGATGKQPFVKDAPVNLVFVAETGRMGRVGADRRDTYAGMDAAFVSQNVYLFCASAGLETVVRASFDETELRKAMKLGEGSRVVLVQTVGYPRK